jgi:hypothetical protein
MRTTILSALLLTALAAPAQAQVYPVEGQWGQSTSGEKGPIDCSDSKRVIDSNGGVPTYRNRSVVASGPSSYRVVDEFSTGQISDGQSQYTLRRVDQNRIEMNSSGGTTTLQRCK